MRLPVGNQYIRQALQIKKREKLLLASHPAYLPVDRNMAMIADALASLPLHAVGRSGDSRAAHQNLLSRIHFNVRFW